MKVIIPDVDTVGKENEIKNWAQSNCKSFIKMDATLESLTPYSWNLNFYFNDEADASWFLLRWL
jgi:hypothetical protein